MISRRGFFAVLAGVLAAPKALFGKKPVAPKRLLDEIWQAANEMRDKAGPGYSVNVWVTQQALDQIREETGASEWHPVKAKRDPKFFVQEQRDIVGAFGDHRVLLAKIHPEGRHWWLELVSPRSADRFVWWSTQNDPTRFE